MKISYLTLYDASDIHKWSGNGYYIGKALENQNAELDYIGDINNSKSSIDLLKQYTYRLIMKRYDYQRTISFAKQFSDKASALIKPDSNIIFSPGSIAVSLLKSKIPKVFYTDATFAGILNFYDNFSNLSNEIIEQGNYIDQQALDSSALAIYSSEWAAQSAIKYYKVHPDKVKVVPFGANIECNRNLNDIKNLVSKRSDSECQLLFIGVDWQRKGGDIALKVANELNELGLKTKLHVVGIKNMEKQNLPSFVVDHGFISKSTREGEMKLDKLFSESHFLIVPSRAEAFGLVFAEASSFGLPSLASNVGGITTAIKDNLNGKTFALEASESEYVSFIIDYFKNKSKYQQLAYSSFNEFEKRLNWKVAGKSIMNLLKQI